MRFLVLAPLDDSFCVEADTATAAARSVAQALYGRLAFAVPVKAWPGRFACMARPYEGADTITIAGPDLSVSALEPAPKRPQNSMRLPPREILACRVVARAREG